MNDSNVSELSRRHFLVQAGLGLAAASTLSRAVAQGSTANTRLRVGLIGCGGRGQFVIGLFGEHGGFEIVGAADYFADRAQEVAAKFKLTPAQTFTGLQCAEKMIAKGGLDGVVICSPPFFHPAQARAAIEAGLHVHLAKPVAVDVPGCQSIAATGALARRKGLVLLVDFQIRANEFYRESMRRIHAGAIGDICFGESMCQLPRLQIKAPPGTAEARLRNWVFDQLLSGDIVVEQNIHAHDAMSWAMKDSPPLRCTGTGGRSVRVDVGDTWDHYVLVYEYPNQVGITFSSRQFDAHGLPDQIFHRMFGPKGVLVAHYGGDVMIRGGADTFYRGGATGTIYKQGAATNIESFHELILKKDAANSTVDTTVTSNLISIMGRMAAQEKRTVTWSEVVASKRTLEPDLSGLVA